MTKREVMEGLQKYLMMPNDTIEVVVREGKKEKKIGSIGVMSDGLIDIVLTGDDAPITILKDFLNRNPKTKLDRRGLPINICPHMFGYDNKPVCDDENMYCTDCWNREFEGGF